MIVMAKGRGGNAANLRKGKKSGSKKKKSTSKGGRPFAASGGAFSYSPRGR
ncbi:hypothetical protein [Streptomyces violaceusniger]|uniref:Uncharacterized protein n=1 Tax=Streptomyces violaceusniger (strain Tu 4113) TaxID=653045 RepID=G2PHH5_STRV4|nr:hypothetical protein [Streptomyces violaceusniger]AEM88821.1 hypothetical protein Strvi_0044 [Streptomyces violaceusniger Tu 4113]